MSATSELIKGIWKENPVFRLALGLCPVLALSTSIPNAIGMGIALTFVLIGSNAIISAIRKGVPGKIRICIFIVVIAAFVTIADMVMHAYQPALHKSLGIFVPLIVVNCIVLGRAEAFAQKNGIWLSILDAIGMGIGFTAALTAIAIIREILGFGTLMGFPILGQSFEPVILMILAPGAFITMGLMLGGLNMIVARQKKAQK